MNARRTPVRCTLLAVPVLWGCGSSSANSSQAFGSNWQNDQGASISQVQKRLATARVPEAPAAAVGVGQKGLVGVTLPGGSRWTHTVNLDARPALAGSVVVASGGGAVFALDVSTGKQLWTTSSDGRALRGAGDDGKITVVTLGRPRGGESLLLAVTRGGDVIRRIEADADLGSPAALAGVAFVPWGNQYVSAIDLGSGIEEGRLLLREQVSHALAIDGSLWFGEIGLTRFDQRIGSAANGTATRVAPPPRALPGSPAWFFDGSQVLPPTASARDRIRLYALPTAEPLGLDSQRASASYFRVALGVSTPDAELRWVRTFDADLIGGDAATGGFVYCDASGKVHVVAAENGSAGKSAELGEPLRSCVVQGGGLRIEAAPSKDALSAQIAKALELREHEMFAAQSFLLKELAPIPEPGVTKTLIDVASNARTPPALLEIARRFLAERRNGNDYMLEALERHYDFLSDVLRPPPVGPLADALAAMNEGRAAPLLARHLNDPANTPDDIERAARALTKLATNKELDELKTFFALYRGTADEEALVRAVLYTATALVRIGGGDGQAIIERAASDPLTHPDVKRGLAELAPPREADDAGAAKG
jgi:outer membrane protein assembly factor BamB